MKTKPSRKTRRPELDLEVLALKRELRKQLSLAQKELLTACFRLLNQKIRTGRPSNAEGMIADMTDFNLELLAVYHGNYRQLARRILEIAGTSLENSATDESGVS